MIALITISLAGLCGVLGASLWSVPLAALGLFSVSLSKHQRLIERGVGLGLRPIVETTLLLSMWNALSTVGLAFSLGAIIRLVS